MDTNVKKFKYSLFNKILCVALSLLCFTGSVSLAATAFVSTEYLSGFPQKDKDVESEFYESDYFVNNLRDDLVTAVNYAVLEEKRDEVDSLLQSKKEETVEKAYKELLKWKSSGDAVAESNDYYDEDAEYTTMTQYDVSVLAANYDGEDIYFTFYPDEVKSNADYNSLNYKDELAYKYDLFVGDEISRYVGDYDVYRYSNSLNLSVKYGDYTVENSKALREEALNSEIYLYYSDGELLYGGISGETAQNIINSCIEDENMDKTAVCLYFNPFPDMETLIFSPNLWNDKYSSLMEFHKAALSFENNRVLIVVMTVALMAVSFICAFYYFSITGRKKENEQAKLFITDKLPFDIHLIISLAAGIIIVCFLFVIGASINFYSSIIVAICAVIAVVVWAILFEFCSYVARFTHSDREIRKNLAVYKLFKLIVRILRKIKSSIKQSAENFVKTLSYKPNQLKTYTFGLVGGYVVINCILLLIIISLGSLGPAMLFFLMVLAIFNCAVIWYVLRFIKYLDEIITCAKNGEKFSGDKEKLPNVLKILVDSLENTNELLNSAVRKAVKDERLKTELITNVSHDLKTPLTSIISYVDLLSKCDIQDEKAKEYISVLEDKGGKLKRLIEDLIEASKVTSGNITVNPTKLNLNELSLQAVGENQTEFEKNGLEVVVNESENPPVIFADGLKAFRIFENLLSNARKYSATGSRVYVSTYEDGNMGVFEIKNISAEPLNISPDELTERFVRGDKSRTKEGNGLGLSIAKELCTVQKGVLEITIDGDLFKAKVKFPLAK